MGRKGFSLIELMFVFVLAGVIMAIGFPRLRNSV
ncbi:MAG: prepilin-type cleavage/methylation domain-containing protein, partial [Gemmatimonadetes bacterium]